MRETVLKIENIMKNIVFLVITTVRTLDIFLFWQSISSREIELGVRAAKELLEEFPPSFWRILLVRH